jgi:hypothetical protein
LASPLYFPSIIKAALLLALLSSLSRNIGPWGTGFLSPTRTFTGFESLGGLDQVVPFPFIVIINRMGGDLPAKNLCAELLRDRVAKYMPWDIGTFFVGTESQASYVVRTQAIIPELGLKLSQVI